MQVYDRVIPAQSYPTLYVLFSGVLIAAVFNFILKITRGHVTDLLGKRGDIRISDRVFGHALRLKNSAVPRSTGSFISQIRELEQVREMMTSTMMTVIADLPFSSFPTGTVHCFALVELDRAGRDDPDAASGIFIAKETGRTG